MNNYANDQMDTSFDFKTYLWDLLSQWKAVLLFAILTALLLTGAKYVSDDQAYKEAKESQRVEEKAQKPVEDRIDEILKSFSNDDKETIQYLVQQKRWLKEQREYLRQSILLNVNPTNQKTLILDFLVTCDDPGATTAIINGYQGSLYSEDTIKKLGPNIDPEAGDRYLAELISFGTDKSYGANKDIAVIPNLTEAILEIKVVLPETADIAGVENIIKESINNYSDELNRKVHPHEVDFIGADCSYLYNYGAVTERTSIVNSINSVQNNLKNTEGNYSDEVNGAVASILKIFGEKEGIIEETVIEKPSLNPFIPIVGLVVGILVYAAAYLVVIIIRGKVISEKEACEITKTRNLGVINYNKEHKGLDGLFHSDLINKYRYRGSKNLTAQVESIIESISAGCKHSGAKAITIMKTFAMHSDEKMITDSMLQRLNEKGIETNIIEADKKLDEQKLLETHNLVYLVTNKTPRKTLRMIDNLCNEYDIKQNGSVFINAI